jgi:Mrp family chromosome partitioning ATPase
LRDTIFALIIGLLVGIAVVFGLELLDRRLILVSTLESLYERTVLAVLPHATEPAPHANGFVSVAPEHVEAIRTLVVNIQVENRDHAWKTLLITSAMPGEGKSTIARALALAYAAAGQRALVIDADLRRPTMNAAFGLPASPGLSHVLTGKASLAEAVKAVPLPGAVEAHTNGKATMATQSVRANNAVAAGETSSGGDVAVVTEVAAGTTTTRRKAVATRRGAASRKAALVGAEPGQGALDVLPHGEPVDNPVAILSTGAWQATMDLAADSYDIVIVDSAPILTVADSIPLIDHVSMVLLVTRLGMTTRESASRIKALFRRVPGANLVGLVANDMRDEFLDEGYGTYRYAYAYQNHNGAPPSRRSRFKRS